MSQIIVESFISMNVRPLMQVNDSRTGKNGTVYPDNLELKVHKVGEYNHPEKGIIDTEDTFIVKIDGDSLDEIKELSLLLRRHDYAKEPLQLKCAMFSDGKEWGGKESGFISIRNKYESTSLISAKGLISKFKK